MRSARVGFGIVLICGLMILSGCFGGSSKKVTSISPASTTFDKNVENLEDLVFTVTWGSEKLITEITNADTALSSEDYHVISTQLVITKEYLVVQNDGQIELNVTFAKGSTVTLAIAVFDSTESEFAGGTGTEADPYLIATAAHLNNVRNHLDSHFLQIANLDLSEYAGGVGFEPIGVFVNDGHPDNEFFRGSYDGDGYRITNLTINRPGIAYPIPTGLFNWVEDAEFRNVVLEETNVTGYAMVGALAGVLRNSSVINCHAAGSVTGTYHTIGGLVGYNYGGTILQSSSAGSVSVGEGTGGGLAGRAYDALFQDSFSTAEVTGVGPRLGGLVGSFESSSIARYCYAVGDVNGSGDDLGGLVGWSTGSILDSYYDTNTTGQSDNGLGTPKTTLEMVQEATYSGWDFASIWEIDANGSYPYHQAQPDRMTIIPTATVVIDIFGSGSTEPTAGEYVYLEDSLVSLQATADPGWEFAYWEINDSSVSDASTEIQAIGEVTVTAVFRNPDFAGGAGTADAPYQIETAQQLYRVRNYLDGHFIVTDNIDLSIYAAGTGWEPIGSYSDPFVGTFDGNGHEISSLTINGDSNSTQLGLFGGLGTGGEVRSVSLTNVDVRGGFIVAGLVGYQLDGSVIDCEVQGVVESTLVSNQTDSFAGGLIGRVYNSSAEIKDSRANVHVTGNSRVGGLVGENAGTIENCFSTGSVTGRTGNTYYLYYATGGLVGVNKGAASIYRSYASGTVTGYQYLGGLVGLMLGGTVEESFALGDVAGTDLVGGLIGYEQNRTTITDCFALGDVSGNTSVGGLIGFGYGAVNSFAAGAVSGTSEVGGLVGRFGIYATDSYYDTDTTGQDDTGKGEPKSTEEMQQEATFVNWDFAGTWAIGEGVSYPYLLWYGPVF